MEPSTPVKFAFGLIQLGLGFAMLYFGAQTADADGMVASYWLLLMYLLLTTGELCLSPVGLSMVTKLSPARLVSTVMGSWFLATAFSQFLAAIIAQFAAVDTGDGKVVPIPAETVHIYGDVYKLIAIMAVVSGIVCLVISPLLKRWMHTDKPVSE
jgi:POT family proton-dependent oligopeptide transporter